MLDLTGEKYGILTVLQEAPRKGNSRAWTCQCECGNVKDIRQSDLRCGKTLSCGCLGKQKRAEGFQIANEKRKENPKPYKDLTGQKFNRLTVIEFDLEYTKNKNKENSSNRFSYWKCQCDCGQQITVRGADITGEHIKSCGCLLREKAAKNMKETVQPIAVENMTAKINGQKFGKLTVLNIDKERSGKGKGSFWWCQCECGTVKSISVNALVSGRTQSCGCLGKSLGEAKILQILLDNKINFQREVKFEDLRDEQPLRFDFAIYDENNKLVKLIEYNGRQHTSEQSIWHTEKVVLHDKMKITYCQQKGIELLVIPYQDLEKIDLEYLGL